MGQHCHANEADGLQSGIDALRAIVGGVGPVWGRVFSSGFVPRLAGDVALESVIRFAGKIMAWNLDLALGEAGRQEANAAAEGLRFLGALDLADVLERGLSVVERVRQNGDAINYGNLNIDEVGDLTTLGFEFADLLRKGSLAKALNQCMSVN